MASKLVQKQKYACKNYRQITKSKKKTGLKLKVFEAILSIE